MRVLLIILLGLFVAASLALIMVRNPGYVLIAREPYVLETSLAVFALLLAALFVIFYYNLRLASRILRTPHALTRWRQARRTRRAREAWQAGLTHLLAGEWLEAEKSLLASLHAADSPFLCNLAAAVAAHEQNDRDKRDRYLTEAQRHVHETDGLAAALLQARLQLAGGELEPAHATLARLHSEHPKHAETARLLIEVFRRLHDWPSLSRLLPEARKRRWLAEAELDRLERDLHHALLSLNLPVGTLAPLRTAWSAMPAAWRDDPALVATYARQLLRHGAFDECARLLEATLENHWNEELVQLYGQIPDSQPAARFDIAEEWLARHGESAVLILTLGLLAAQVKRPDRARFYLEKSLALAASAEAHEALAALHAEAGESAPALEHYRRALQYNREIRAAAPVRPAAAKARGETDYGY